MPGSLSDWCFADQCDTGECDGTNCACMCHDDDNEIEDLNWWPDSDDDV